MSEELRIKIAESLGWKITVLREGELTQTWHVHPNGVSWFREPPAYDEDANAALQLVEVLEKDGWFPQIKLALNHSKNKWGCAFSAYGKPQHFATAPTLPEAICLAYCAVKSIQTDK